jgi:two-component system, cell cycle response regulator
MGQYKRFSVHNLSLREKLLLSLLVTSLVSTSLVGGFAYWRLTQKFDSLVQQESVRRFTADVSDYFRAYGSWEEGQKRESFRSFTERRNALLGRPVGGKIGPAPVTGQSATAPGAGSGSGLGPALPGLTPDSLVVPPVAPGVTPPAPSNVHRPPFRFYLFDEDFRSLSDLAPYKLREKVRAEHVGKLRPIESDGRIVAHYVPEGKVAYSDLDLGYLSAMRDALVAGTLAGLVVTLILGFLLGTRLNRTLRRLTRAVRAMRHGYLKQHVEVESNDEIGMLASAFNRMSDKLARQYKELEESKARIEKMAMQLREISMRDALTQLHNRRYFDEHGNRLFQHALRYHRPFSVMIADIDHFKKINDTYSHAMGDEVLRRIGEILGTRVRASDLVARYGGEEFAIAFPETDLKQAYDTCESLRKRIETYPWHELHPDLHVTISMGLSSDARVADIHAMLAAADELLYRAKHRGRNQVCSPTDPVAPVPASLAEAQK